MEFRNKSRLFSGMVVDLEQMEVRIGVKGWHTYQIIRHPGGVGVLPLHEDGTVTLIRQFRPAINSLTIEIPAGRLEPGEDPEQCGRRELREETGISAAHLEPLGRIYTSPGVFDEAIYLYLATGLTSGEACPEQYEDISAIRIPLADACDMACDGRIADGKTIAAIMRALRRSP